MAAILGAEVSAVEPICADAAMLTHEDGRQEQQVVQVANDNGGGQVVISGHRDAVARAMALAKERGIKRALPLPVSAPFHCALMQPAADTMRDVLERTDMVAPVVPLIANVTAEREMDPGAIRDLLIRQVTGMVRWRESLLAAVSMGVTSVVELGAGKVLSGLAKRIDPELRIASAGSPAEIEALLKAL